MKNLQPSMRERTRYLKFKIHSEEKLEISEMVEAFWESTISYMGIKDLSEANPWFIGNKFDEDEQEGVVRVNRGYADDLRASLLFISDINGNSCYISVENISGSI